MNYNIKVKRTIAEAIIPTKGSDYAAGYDLYIPKTKEPSIIIAPKEKITIDTGIAMEIPAGYVGLVFVRSSIGIKRNIKLQNQCGVIDSDYRGNIMVAIQNTGLDPQELERGERIAQLIIVPYLANTTLFEVSELEETKRGSGGIGSSGRM